MLISESYREQNKKLHELRHDYGASGHKHAPQVRELCELLNTQNVLDYGCGKGTLQDALNFEITQYDPALVELCSEPHPHDIVCCLDVLEHIEPECLDAVLDDLARVTRKVFFATIATRPAVKFLPDGRNAHLIQEHLQWWLPKLWERFTIMSVNNAGNKELIVLAGPLDLGKANAEYVHSDTD